MAKKSVVKHSPKKPSFFKILVGDFSHCLRIPPKFIENFDGESLRKCLLRGPSGQWWDVKVVERNNGLFFHDGWEGFVNDHCLQAADFLIFSYDGKSNFDVTIYDRSACEKDVEVAKRENQAQVNKKTGCQGSQDQVEGIEHDSDNYRGHLKNKIVSDRQYCRYIVSGKRGGNTCVEETPTGLILFKSENSCFIVSLKNDSYRYRVRIPKALAVAEGLMRKLSVILQDPTGRSWRVQLVVDQRLTFCNLEMRHGWSECRKANGISLRDTIVFECVKQGVLQIHIFKERELGDKSLVIAAPTVEH